MKKKDLTDMKFGKLTVLYEDKSKKYERVHWICKCDCGNIISVGRNELRDGHTKSCGCLKLKNNGLTTRTNYRDNRLYNIWRGIKKRCTLPSDKDYKNYGGRGIQICNEWLNSYIAFHDWAINHGYSDNLTIDRINVNGNYEPSNCRWATMTEQNNNKRSNIYFTNNNITKSLSDWCRYFNISYKEVKSKYMVLKKKLDVVSFDDLFDCYS